MAIITFYPLIFQVWMSFTDYGLKNLQVGRSRPRLRRALELRRTSSATTSFIPNFDFLRILIFNLFWAFSNVVIHVVLGVAIASC